MIAILKHILIEATLKEGFVIRIDGKFGIVESINGDKAKVKFTDDSTGEYTVEELSYCVAKFLAIMKDHKSFPVVHGDFFKIIYSIDNEKAKNYIEGKIDLKVEGSLVKILSYPKVDDIVELTSLKKAEQYNLLKNKADRLGIVKEIKPSSKSPFIIEFHNKTIALKRTDFSISNNDYKQIFKLND